MAATITTVTKTASLVKTTKSSEKKWSEILSMNRRYDLQLPLDIEKFNNEFKRTYNLYERQQIQTERAWAHKHETWYHDDFLFRNHLLKQLQPITQRFKYITSLSSEDQQSQEEMLNEDEIEILPLKKASKKELSPLKRSNKELPPLKRSNKELAASKQTRKRSNKELSSLKKPKKRSNKEFAPLKQTRKRSISRHFQTSEKEEPRRPGAVLSKLVCPKILRECQPKLYSHSHAPFLDIAQRFLKRKPEMIEKDVDFIEKQKQQKQYLKVLIENEQERTRLATIKFGQQLEDEKNKDNEPDNDDDDYYYY